MVCELRPYGRWVRVVRWVVCRLRERILVDFMFGLVGLQPPIRIRVFEVGRKVSDMFCLSV